MTDEEAETVAQMLYELDRQNGIRLHRWHTDAETRRNRYRLRARRLLAVEDFASLVARLGRQYRRTGHLVHEASDVFRLAATPNAYH
jgi:hypothetical protein